MTANETTTQVVKRHGRATRLWHWLNALCLLVLFMSGLQIFNAHPALYWGEQSHFDSPVFQITAKRMPNGTPVGVTKIGDVSFHTTGFLGLSQHDGQLAARAFPDWITLPSPQWLAMGRHWHFTFAWIFAPLLFAYIVFTLINRYRRTLIVPSGREWRDLPREVLDHLRLRFNHGLAYNSIQKLTYLIVIFGVLPLMVATGVTMSPTVNAAWPWLLDIFGGRQSARTIHFIGTFALLAFFLIHIVLVLISGVINNMRSITTGGYRIDPPAKDSAEPYE